ncbi:hypothetical protein [Leptothoe sp. PORK10 BA2]|jgi:hypothetical protein|uniref:hypothetical protein n=1 Tax=Leptothoe sp. PORK10 BA2 TaxID=3110254 RepID=UPI002B1ECE69|nr:hypothetical protein [Leptothoe sp. PORK10 BA2]MEA5466761.1 hypothetical protein [Leptothoe sp. PORK10 BA2]
MDRSKIVAIITGAISLVLAIAYLLLVQLLDFRGEMVPAPLSTLPMGTVHQILGILASLLAAPSVG